ncbi:MAG: CRISPR-associated endonuclease Cas2 [Candidatus Rehaiarchaeum fermentans]|nr:CRISPR-associated endonuclease Cas2 [Candidatus Rehaiarchaeum fermentans]
MFVIITYDVEEKRINRVRKKLKSYMTWVQNSVFEGELTEGKLEKCLTMINKIIDKEADSIYVYKVSIPKNIEKSIIGKEKNYDNFIL